MSVIGASGSQSVERYIPREVRPCLDLRIDLGKVLEREALEADPLLRGERLARHLLLKSDVPDPKDRKFVWLRVFPQYDHDEYALIDPTTDPEKGGLFAVVNRFEGHVGDLDDFAAPSFHGYKAFNVVRNLMALLHINHLFFCDGSETLPCCKSGAVTPLRPLSVFMNGKSWYEMQGATSKSPDSALRTYRFESELCTQRPEFYGFMNSSDPVMAHPRDFDRKVFEWSTTHEHPSYQAAYARAKDLLHSVSIKEFEESLLRFGDRNPSLQELRKTLQQASSIFPSCMSVGELLKALKQTKEGSLEHRLLHELRDELIPNNESSLSECSTYKLSKAETPNKFSCTLAWFVLNLFFSKIAPYPKISRPNLPVTIDMLLKADRQQLDTMTAENQLAFTQWIWTEEKGITREKDKDFEDPFLSAQQALQHIVRIPISVLRTIYPDLAETLVKRCHLSETSIVAGCTIEDIVASSEPSEKEWILNELIWGAKEHLSTLFIRCMEKREPSERTEELCLLVMLAKYICEQTRYFVLNLP